MSRAWQEMTHEELTEELEAGREEAQRRMQQMAELLGMAQPSSGKPGRPPKNAFRFGGEARPENEDVASSAAQ